MTYKYLVLVANILLSYIFCLITILNIIFCDQEVMQVHANEHEHEQHTPVVKIS